MNKIEYIICSAIYNPGDLDIAGQPLIYCGLRHNNILWQGQHISRNPHHQGFLTNLNRFVDRAEARIIALVAGQIEDDKTYSTRHLFSEDLY